MLGFRPPGGQNGNRLLTGLSTVPNDGTGTATPNAPATTTATATATTANAL
jgi:hypothetical protein